MWELGGQVWEERASEVLERSQQEGQVRKGSNLWELGTLASQSSLRLGRLEEEL